MKTPQPSKCCECEKPTTYHKKLGYCDDCDLPICHTESLTPSETETLKMFDDVLSKEMSGILVMSDERLFEMCERVLSEKGTVKNFLLTQLRVARADERKQAYEDGLYEKEQEFIAHYQKGYEDGKKAEKKEWIDILPKETIMFSIKVRSADDKVEHIRHLMTFDEIRRFSGDIIIHMFEEVIRKFAVGSGIIKELLTARKA